MGYVNSSLFKTIPCPLNVYPLLWSIVEQHNDQGLRIEIRGTFRNIWTGERVLLLDWHSLASWSECFKVMGLFPLPFDEERKPWPPVRYLIYEGPGELRFRGLPPHMEGSLTQS
jgi:hypothetical protein